VRRSCPDNGGVTTPSPIRSRTPLGRSWLPLLVAVAMAVLLTRTLSAAPSTGIRLAAATGLVGTAAWVLRTVAARPGSRTEDGLLLVMLLTGGLAAAGTDVAGFAPALVGVLTVVAAPARPARQVAGAVLLAGGALGAGLALASASRTLALVLLGTLALVTLAALTRRSARRGESAERAALEQRLAAEQERARSAALEERARIARDLHDVLAHTLGGLVVQLDALGAELEAGRADDARDRADRARDLAVSGLDEARRAVAALHGTDTDTLAAVQALLRTHRSLGGTGDLETTGVPATDPGTVDVLRRSAQELLTNARRHAPGAPVHLRLEHGGGTRLTVAVPRVAEGPARSPGGGTGLLGLRDRVTAAGGSVTIDASDPFVVTVEVP
jgi:signal transduction histidine kinase